MRDIFRGKLGVCRSPFKPKAVRPVELVPAATNTTLVRQAGRTRCSAVLVQFTYSDERDLPNTTIYEALQETGGAVRA
jgi:hypothetical protein